jgi:hypothetical protein
MTALSRGPSPKVWAAWPILVSRDEWNDAFSVVVDCLSDVYVSVAYLNVGNNTLSGQVPTSFADLSMLIEFTLSGNTITGAIPSGMCSIAGLTTMVPDCVVTCDCCSSCV